MNFNSKRAVQIFLISILILSCFFTYVNKFSEKLIPNKEVTITVLDRESGGNEVWILEKSTHTDSDVFNRCLYADKIGVWEYREKEKFSYDNSILVSYGENSGSKINFICSEKPDIVIQLWKMMNGGKISVEYEGHKEIIDLYSKEGEMINFHPFAKSNTALIIKVLIYAVLFILVYLSVFLAISGSEKKNIINKNRCKKIDTKMFLCGFILIYIYSIFQYEIGIPNFMPNGFGDQVYYWNSINFFDGEAWFLKNFAMSSVSFRGYICSIAPAISQKLGVLLGIDSFYIYFIFSAFFASMLIFYSLPKLYEFTTGKKADVFKCIIFLVVYVIYFNGNITAVLMDMPAVSCFFASIVFLLNHRTNEKKMLIMLSGLFMAMTCLYRSSYKHFILGCLIIILFIIALNFIKKKKQAQILNTIFLKKIIISSTLWAIVFVVTCIPQAIINNYKGHIGLLPYDYSGSWDGDYTLCEISANSSFSNIAGYPYGIVSDSQVQNIKNEFYYMDERLKMSQILNLFIENPSDSLTYIGKKLVAGFDVKTSVAYPIKNMSENTGYYLFSLFNYFILFSGLYAISAFDTKRLTKVLFFVILFFLILPQTFVHIEWRYFLPGYVVIYYVFAYFFSDVLIDKDVAKKVFSGNYLFCLSLFMFLMQWISTTFYCV